MKDVQSFVDEGPLKNSLENTLNNVEDISVELKGLVIDMKNKEGTIGKLLYDDGLYKNAEEFIADLKAHPWKLLHKPKEPKKKRK